MSLLDAIPEPNAARFDGDHYDPASDDARLTGQIRRVHEAMRDGRWRTLDEIAAVTHDPPASVSAQLRHLRKERFGAYLVEMRSVAGRPGLHEYRLGDKGAGRPQIGHHAPEVVTTALAAADALIPYLRHAWDCLAINSLRSDGLGQCDCGLVEARRAWTAARQATRRG